MDWLEVQNLPECGGESTTMAATAMKNKRSASFCEDNSVDLLCHENFSDYSSLFDDDESQDADEFIINAKSDQMICGQNRINQNNRNDAELIMMIRNEDEF